MTNRQRHPKKDLEKILQLAEAHGWRCSRGKGYYRCLCPCGKHKRTVVLTPSDPNYAKNVVGWFKRQPCWED